MDEYIRRLKSYAGADELTRRMALDLIEYITLDENPRKKSIPRDIHIYYKLIDRPLTDKKNGPVAPHNKKKSLAHTKKVVPSSSFCGII